MLALWIGGTVLILLGRSRHEPVDATGWPSPTMMPHWKRGSLDGFGQQSEGIQFFACPG
jgi:hypothetical protein